MNETTRHAPFWAHHGNAAPRAPYPALDRGLDVDTAVVGAGISGLTAALLLARAGQRVAVFEARQVASGATAYSSAHLTYALDRPYATLISRFGEEGARLAVQGSMTAIDFIERTSMEGRIACDFERVPGFRFTERGDEADSFDRELDAARNLGLPVSWTNAPPLPFPVVAALRFPDQARIHPLNYALGLARLVQEAGGLIFEDSRVEEVEDGAPCRLRVAGRSVKAGAVFHATHSPLNRVITVQTRVAPYTSYVVAVRVPTPVPDALFWDTAEPYHYLRRATDARGDVLIVGGEDHKTGQEAHPGAHYERVLEYVTSRFGLPSVEALWSNEVFEPADGLPYIGRMPGTENEYVASGFSGTGLTFGTLAGQIVSDLALRRENRWIPLFSPSRLKPLASAASVLKENLNTAWHLLSDRVKRGEVAGLDELLPGEGRVVELDGRKVAVYRDEHDGLHMLSPVCTHLGCIVGWNGAERTWDCPCHGSRFTPTGQVLCAPATKPLPAMPLDKVRGVVPGPQPLPPATPDVA